MDAHRVIPIVTRRSPRVNDNDRIHTESDQVAGNAWSASHGQETSDDGLCSDRPTVQRNHSVTPHMGDKLRRRTKFFFMNPWQKWKARRKFPWKLFLQLLKIVMVTVQLVLFGFNRAAHITFLENNNVAFEHLFLKDWDSTHETMPYPPAIGPYAVYTKTSLYQSIDFAMHAYDHVSDAIGTYWPLNVTGTPENISLCKTYFKRGQIFPNNKSFVFNSRIETDCFPVYPLSNDTHNVYDIEDFLKKKNRSIEFDRLIKIELRMSLITIDLKTDTDLDEPDCFQFDITILFDNSGRDGKLPVKVSFQPNTLDCDGDVVYDEDDDAGSKMGLILLDTSVILISLLSFVLCIRSLIRAHLIKREVMVHFWEHFRKKLSVHDRLEFLNLWYVLIVINDVLTIVGSAFKIKIENKDSGDYEVAGVFLGTGNLLVWFGVLRYLGFFHNYNVLILTMKKAAPNVFRFLICALVFYSGFTFCGWVVLGPYHIKFRQVSTASECLFSLVNGDDMFVTFSVIGANVNNYVWYYSRVYLYTFISLFIYIVLSLFLAVIMDTYETIKRHYEDGSPKSDLMKFIAECDDDATSLAYRAEDQNSCNICCCCIRSDPDSYHPNERTSLIR